MATRKNGGVRAPKVSAALLDLWRRAMRGDDPALDALLPEALQLDPTDPRGEAARRLVVRALQSRTRQLQAEAALLPGPEGEALREAARKRYYQAVLARHVNLRAAASTASLFTPAPSAAPDPVVAAARERVVAADESACLLDPPPDAPGEPMAANQAPLLAGAGGVLLRWEVPDDHGKPIKEYRVSVQPKPLAYTTSFSANSVRIGGLLAGSYSFRVTAVNDDGPSSESASSNTVTIGEAPAGKTGAVTVRSNGGLLAVEWLPAPASPAVTEHWLVVYDAATPGRVVARKRVAAQSSSAAFGGLAKGNYIVGVRAIAKGGFGEETRSAALVFTPNPSPFEAKPKPFSADSLLHFKLGDSGLDPQELARRLTGAMDTAGKWRFDYLKSLAVKAANDTVAYEQHIAQFMQMAVSKVSTAQLLLSPVLQEVLAKIKNEVQDLKSLATSDQVQGLVKQVGEAAATALSLEGLILFLMDRSPFNFWIGLFEGLICDIACFDTGMTETNKFLETYFQGIGGELKNYIKSLVGRIDQTIDELAVPLRAAIGEVISGTSAALGEVMKAFGDPPLMQALSPDTGEILPTGNPLGVVEGTLKQLDSTLSEVLGAIKKAVRDTLDNALGGTGLLIKLVKVFIVYPILGILVVSFAGGFIAAGIIAGIVLALGIELLRQVAKWLAGPLLDQVAAARQLVLDTVDQFKQIFERQLALLDSPQDQIKLVSGHLAELRALLPQAFLTEAAALLGDARRSLLAQGSQLALAAERALGLEHCTAFDVITGTYQRPVSPAPQLPGGADEGFLGGAAMLRDLNLLEAQRTLLQDGKEVVLTQRLSLFRLLGGVGDPLAASGEVLKALNELLSGGRIVLKLSEELLVDRGFPGLYRVLIDDIQPRGVFAEAYSKAKYLLPMSIPLTLTHLGPARTRIKRRANQSAPPLELQRVLQVSSDELCSTLFSPAADRRKLLDELLPPGPGEASARTLQELVHEALQEVRLRLQVFQLGELAVPIYRYHHAGKGLHGFNQSATWHQQPGNQDWAFEGARFYAFRSKLPGTVPLYGMRRKTDPYDHFYTSNEAEIANAGADNFDVEPRSQKVWVVCHVFPLETPGTVNLYRFLEQSEVRHFYTTDFNEGKNNFSKEGFAMCGVRDSATPFLLTVPEVASNLAQVRRALGALPAQVGALLGPGSGGLLGAGVVAAAVGKLIDLVLKTPGLIPEASDPGQSPDPAQVRARLETALDALEPRLLNALLQGYPVEVTETSDRRQVQAGLQRLLAQAHATGVREAAGRLAKWAGATITEDRDPHIRALGFCTLEQKLPAESAIFNLLPDPTPVTGALSQAGSAFSGLAPVTSLSTLQYRPFENRPLDTEFLVSLDTALPLGALTDLLFEVRVRACYDENLAAAVKASRSQRSGMLDQANQLAAGANRVLRLPETLVMRDFTSAATRTFNLSLRAHRDNLVQLAEAAARAIDGTAVPRLLLDVTQLKPLASAEPLRPLKLSDGRELSSIGLQFQKQKPASLESLAQLIAVTPEDFGFSVKQLGEDLFNTLLGAEAGELVSLGMAIIPALDEAGRARGDRYENIRGEIDKITARIDPLLGSLLPGLTTGSGPDTAVARRLMLTEPGTSAPVSWKALWSQAQFALPEALPKLLAKPKADDKLPPFLQLELGDALKKGLIYDVIFSISTRIPVRLLNPASAVS